MQCTHYSIELQKSLKLPHKSVAQLDGSHPVGYF